MADVIKLSQSAKETIVAYNRIPYALLEEEARGELGSVVNEFAKIIEHYKTYREGASFILEGSNGDYKPADLKYKMASTLINKEARFLFAEAPDVDVKPKTPGGVLTESLMEAADQVNQFVGEVLVQNDFEQSIIKAAKDCFIGGRVAAMVNFDPDDGIAITFLPPYQFLYDTKGGSPNVLSKFVSFSILEESKRPSERRIFKKKYTLEDQKVMLEETIYNGAGVVIDTVTPKSETLLDEIPAIVIVNDGLTGDESGESEIGQLVSHESWYSKLSNSDIDAERKSMNPIRYTVDMDNQSTKGLSSSAGSYWDLMSDQNLPEPNPSVGMLESSMRYSESLKTSLDRIKTSGYEQVDMPNINLETMAGIITSGKALKAIYWPLIVRCKEKMKTWGPQLERLVRIVIEGAYVYPKCISKYADRPLTPLDYIVTVTQNTPLPEDELEDKRTDLSEVESQTMSRKLFMKKWRGMTDAEVDQELEQIALERQMLEDATFSTF